MRSVLIVWDEDGVLYNWVHRFNEFMGRPADERWGSWRHYREWGVTDEEFGALLCRFGDEGWFAEGRPHADGIAAVRAMQSVRGVRNVTVTAKMNARAFEDAGRWLARQGVVIDRFRSSNKADGLLLAAPHEEVFALDDHAENVEHLLACGARAFLRSRPWNADATHLPRVGSALEFSAHVLDYLQEAK